MEYPKMKRIAIIGAGTSGLCVARHLTSYKYKDKCFEIIVFERQEEIGGTWNYNKEYANQDASVTPIYKDLITNFPKELMSFPDFPYQDNLPSFLHHSVVKEYLNNYADYFNLKQHIKFQTEVCEIRPAFDEFAKQYKFIEWKIKWKDLVQEKMFDDIFDGVVVCNGRYWKPRIPNIKGIDKFKGKMLHSKFFNEPQSFTNETVVVCGYQASGADIVQQIYKFSKYVYISIFHPSLFKPVQPDNVNIVGGITEVDIHGNIILQDGKSLVADSIIFCTGYEIEFPFLKEPCCIKVKENGRMVFPLYKHIFNINYPSMAFVGLLKGVPIFSATDIQSSFVALVFSQVKTLPTKKEMLEDTDKEIEHRKSNGYQEYHSLTNYFNDYANGISSISEENFPSPVIFKLLKYVIQEITTNFYKIRKYKYTVLDSNSFKCEKLDD